VPTRIRLSGTREPLLPAASWERSEDQRIRPGHDRIRPGRGSDPAGLRSA